VAPAFDRLSRFDPADGRVLSRVNVCDSPVAVAADASSAWVACSTERMLQQVLENGEIGQSVELAAVPTSVTLHDGSVWVTLRTD
jgi:hypothetical protein